MRRTLVFGLMCACVLWAITRANRAAELTGREIIQKMKDLHAIQDEEESLDMLLKDKKGRKKKRAIKRYTLKGSNGQHKIRIAFLSPRDIKGLGLLTWEHEGAADDQWLYLPALRKVKRIASDNKQKPFAGTDFSYEDLQPEDMTVHEYKLVGEEEAASQACYVVEAFPSTDAERKDSGYSKRKFWVRKDIFFAVKIEYYDKKGRHVKVQTQKGEENVAGTVWRSKYTTMRDLKKKHETLLRAKKRELNKGLSSSQFTERALKEGK